MDIMPRHGKQTLLRATADYPKKRGFVEDFKEVVVGKKIRIGLPYALGSRR